MSTTTAFAVIAVVVFLIGLAIGAWRARNRPPPPLSASSAIGMLPDPPDVGGAGGP